MARKRKDQLSLKYFFWDGLLHRVIRINRPMNLVDAWCYRDHKRVAILHSDWRMSAKPAVTMKRAAEIMNLSRRSLARILAGGQIHHPQRSYPLHNQSTEKGYAFWGESDLMELHDYLMTVHVGRPRLDGEISPRQTLPTKAEIKARLSNTKTLYLKNDDGTFVPLYEPPKF